MELVTQVQIQHEAAGIVNMLGKGMNPTILPSAISSRADRALHLWYDKKSKTEFKPMVLCLKNDLRYHFSCGRGVG